MPLYQCLVPAESLNAELRADLAEAITTVHTSVTGAPRGFVNVVFTEYEPQAFFTAGKPNAVSVIGGTIRAGRDRAARAELLTRLSEAWTAITGQGPCSFDFRRRAARYQLIMPRMAPGRWASAA